MLGSSAGTAAAGLMAEVGRPASGDRLLVAIAAGGSSAGARAPCPRAVWSVRLVSLSRSRLLAQLASPGTSAAATSSRAGDMSRTAWESSLRGRLSSSPQARLAQVDIRRCHAVNF